MQFAKCGIRGRKEFFLLPEKAILYSKTIGDNIHLDGRIDQCPCMDNFDYVFHWITGGNLPINFDMSHLKTRVDKTDAPLMDMLKEAR